MNLRAAHAAVLAAQDSLRSVRRGIADWLLAESSRLDRMEMTMSAQTDAWIELDGQLDALQTAVDADDQADAAEVTKRTARIRDLVNSLSPQHPAPAPGEPGAIEPNTDAPAELPSVDGDQATAPDSGAATPAEGPAEA